MKPYPIHCVSIVIPVYNEQESLPELLRRTMAACKQLAYEYEIILVDDGSRDNSAQLLEDAAALEGSNVVAVILNRNYGQHAAIMAGFEHCRGDVVITLDADLQNPPEEIPRLVEQAARCCRVRVGSAQGAPDALERLANFTGDDPQLVGRAFCQLRQGLEVLVSQKLLVRVALMDCVEDLLDGLGLTIRPKDGRLGLTFGLEDGGLTLPFSGQDC